MAEERVQRQLAVVLFAHVAGYIGNPSRSAETCIGIELFP